MELLPIAIQYAPYALMFLELPENNRSIEGKELDTLSAQINVFAQSIEKDSLVDTLSKEWKGKKQFVTALHLNSPEKIQKIQTWLSENRAKFQVKYFIVNFETENSVEYKKLHNFIKQQQIAFLADGPIQDIKMQKESFPEGIKILLQ